MNNNFYELSESEMQQVEGGNPVVVYYAIVIAKHVVLPVAKVAVEAAVGGFLMKAAGDLFK
ncbi:bacteriocin [Cellulosilyticum sp. ST5]|uniref:bacteriocin n=1 Tax=unclassified Cellulosilyticum TaxID=2643091 RepID=UPI000F8D6446|nr:bacteriocin [Cellulosilyticum sp. WCF-2]QEH67513.1 bacteriocin [Cellulosilyticum sp. WCF-2]